MLFYDRHVLEIILLNLGKSIGLDPVHTEPDEFGTGRIFVQIRLAFTRDPRNRTNSSTDQKKLGLAFYGIGLKF